MLEQINHNDTSGCASSFPTAKKILIAENVPSNNKGEMAIVEGLRACLDQTGEYQLSMFSFYAVRDKSTYGNKIGIIDISHSWPMIRDANSGKRLLPSFIVLVLHYLFALTVKLLGDRALVIWRSPVWKAYLEADLILFGHDSNFGIGGDPENPLLYPLYISHIAQLLGKPIMFIAGTVPRLPRRYKRLFRMLFRKALERANAITLRECESKKRIREFGVRQLAEVTADVAYLMQACSPQRVDEIYADLGIDFSCPAIGMTASYARGKLAFPNLSHPESHNEHVRVLANGIDQIIKQLDVNFVFLPHAFDASGSAHDIETARAIRNQSTQQSRIFLIEKELASNELKGMMGRFALFVGERLHSVIGASSMGVPSIAVSYRSDPRLGMVLPMVTDEFVCAIEDLTTEVFVEKVGCLWQKRTAVVAELPQRLARMKKMALSNIAPIKKLLSY